MSKARELTHELQRRGANLLLGRRRLEIKQRADIAAHRLVSIVPLVRGVLRRSCCTSPLEGEVDPRSGSGGGCSLSFAIEQRVFAEAPNPSLTLPHQACTR